MSGTDDDTVTEEEYKEHLEWRDEMLRKILHKLIKIQEKLDSVFSDK